MNCIVTTVHGTFASQAKWPLPNSTLSKYLAEKLPCAVEIRPFRWSGRNSFSAREIAAHQLREHISAISKENPEAHQIVIAHSHGGNIALLASDHDSIKEKVKGIICLSTPFLQAWPRPVGRAKILSASGGIVISLGNIAYFAMKYFSLPPRFIVTSISLGAFPLFFIFGILALRIAGQEPCTLPSFYADRMLIVRTAGDEASAVMGAATLLATLVTRIWSFMAQGATHWFNIFGIERNAKLDDLYKKLEIENEKGGLLYKLRGHITAIYSITLLVASIVAFMRPTLIGLHQFAVIVGGAFVVALSYGWRAIIAPIISYPLWWISCIATIPVLAMLSLLAMFFGPSIAIHHWFWIVSAEPTPPGTWAVVQLNPEGIPPSESNLMHSTLYDDDRAHALIAHRIKIWLGI